MRCSNLLSIFVLLFLTAFSCKQGQDKSKNKEDSPRQQTDSLAGKGVDLAPLEALFEPCQLNPSVHFFSPFNAKSIDNYPYIGTPIPTELIDYLQVTNFSDYKYSPWGVYAICRIDSLFVLRVPGKVGAKEIAAFRKTANRLAYTVLLAGHTCEEGFCTQTDSWLQDLNGDGLRDVVSRSVQTLPSGAVENDLVVARIQGKGGVLDHNPGITLDKSRYPMKK